MHVLGNYLPSWYLPRSSKSLGEEGTTVYREIDDGHLSLVLIAH